MTEPQDLPEALVEHFDRQRNVELAARLGLIGRSMIALGLLVMITIGAEMNGAEFGTFPDWVEAIGTSGAFVFAAGAVVQQSADRHADLLARRREAARLMEVDVAEPSSRRSAVQVSIRNGTPDRVFDLAFRCVQSGENVWLWEVRSLGPGQIADQKAKLSEDGTWRITWYDIEGRRWLRTSDGDVVYVGYVQGLARRGPIMTPIRQRLASSRVGRVMRRRRVDETSAEEAAR